MKRSLRHVRLDRPSGSRKFTATMILNFNNSISRRSTDQGQMSRRHSLEPCLKTDVTSETIQSRFWMVIYSSIYILIGCSYWIRQKRCSLGSGWLLMMLYLHSDWLCNLIKTFGNVLNHTRMWKRSEMLENVCRASCKGLESYVEKIGNALEDM